MNSILMSFAGLIADRVLGIIEKKIDEAVFKAVSRTEIYKDQDTKKNELAAEMADATTKEERYAILAKIKNNTPKFS